MRKMILFILAALALIVVSFLLKVPEVGLGIVATVTGVWFYNAVKELEEYEQL